MESILLGRGSIRTNVAGYSALVSFYDRCKEIHNLHIDIDFSKLTWFDANMSALLHAILHKMEVENNVKFFTNAKVIEEKFSILIRNGLIKSTSSQNRTGSEIHLSGFRKEDDSNFVHYIENKLLSYRNLRITEGDKYELIDAFLEVFCNVQKHANTKEPLFACGQYYPNNSRLTFTLVDLGVGYLPPIKAFTNGQISTAQDAIRWALLGNSTKRDAPGGLGLGQISRFCKANNADFDIVSGNCYWNNNLGFKPLLSNEFCGTTVNIIFRAK